MRIYFFHVLFDKCMRAINRWISEREIRHAAKRRKARINLSDDGVRERLRKYLRRE